MLEQPPAAELHRVLDRVPGLGGAPRARVALVPRQGVEPGPDLDPGQTSMFWLCTMRHLRCTAELRQLLELRAWVLGIGDAAWPLPNRSINDRLRRMVSGRSLGRSSRSWRSTEAAELHQGPRAPGPGDRHRAAELHQVLELGAGRARPRWLHQVLELRALGRDSGPRRTPTLGASGATLPRTRGRHLGRLGVVPVPRLPNHSEQPQHGDHQ